MRDFDFLEPSSVESACQMLAEHPEESRAMAGGTALMLVMRQRMLSPKYVVSIDRLDELRGISFDSKDGLRIGALTVHAELAASPDVRRYYPMLAEMAIQVANPQVRNQGTLGGNLCYADPATDPPSCLMALGADVVISGLAGERRLSMEEFFVDYYTTALRPDELITEIRIPAPNKGDCGSYYRHLRTVAEHRPMANTAAWANLDDHGCCQNIRVVVGAATATAVRVRTAESLLLGNVPDMGSVANAAQLVASDIVPIGIDSKSEEYARKIVTVITRRNLARLFSLSPE